MIKKFKDYWLITLIWIVSTIGWSQMIDWSSWREIGSYFCCSMSGGMFAMLLLKSSESKNSKLEVKEE